jgi:hypothetical protein
MNGQKRRGSIAPYLAALLPILAIAFSPIGAGAVTLGSALGFSALSTTGDVIIQNVAKVGTTPLGSVGGADVTLGNNSSTGGDVIASPGNISIGNFSKIFGACVVPTAGTITKGLPLTPANYHCVGGEVMDSADPRIATFNAAISDVATFVTALLNPALVTGTVPTTVVKNFPSTTFTDTVSGGLNILEVTGDLTLNPSSTLFLSSVSGTATGGEALVLKIDGNLKIGNGAKISLKGLFPSTVLIYVGGNVTGWGNSTTVGATLLAPNAPIAVGSGAKVNGAVIGGGNVTFLQNATLLFNPFLVDIPTGQPQEITLGDAKGFLILSTQGDTTLGHLTFGKPVAPNAGDIGGSTDIIGDFSTIDGDVVASSGLPAAITVGPHAKVVGNCITPGGVVFSGPVNGKGTCGGFGGVGDPKLALLAGSAGDVTTFSAELASLPVDQALPAINVPTSASTIACTATASGAYVFSTPSIKIANSKTLTIDGTACPGAVIVINVFGDPSTSQGGAVNLGSGFTIALVGTTPDHVVFNVEGASVNPTVLNGTNSTFNGTLVAPVQVCKVGSTNVKFNGQLICGSDVTGGDNVTATYMPLVPIIP